MERTITDRLDRRGELERPEDTITTVLTEALQNRLETVNGNLRDLDRSRMNLPAVTAFDFTICDMRDALRDVMGADVAFLFRTRWENEFLDRRGVLVQAKRLGPLSARTRRRLDRESERLYGISVDEWEEVLLHFPMPVRPPVFRRARFPWPFLPSLLESGPDELVLGDYAIDSDQLSAISEVVSSYYLFYDYPRPHQSLPCVQALTIKGLVNAARSDDVYRASIIRHGMPFTELIAHEFVGCRIGEWNSNFEQLAEIADQRRVGRIDTAAGEFNVHAYNVGFVVVLDIKLLPSPYEQQS